jgi:hypothetical protein
MNREPFWSWLELMQALEATAPIAEIEVQATTHHDPVGRGGTGCEHT